MTDERTRIAELAARIDALIEQQHAEARQEASTAMSQSERMWRRRLLQDELSEARSALQAIFERKHGWRRSDRSFSPACLARHGMHSHGNSSWPWPLLDHGNYFRKDRRAAAAIGHVYDIPKDARLWSAEHGLKLTVSRFPSWYWPAQCQLLVYTPLLTRTQLEIHHLHERQQRQQLRQRRKRKRVPLVLVPYGRTLH